MDILAILMLVALFITLNIAVLVYLVIAGASRLNAEDDECPEENQESEEKKDDVDKDHPTITIVVDKKNQKP